MLLDCGSWNERIDTTTSETCLTHYSSDSVRPVTAAARFKLALACATAGGLNRLKIGLIVSLLVHDWGYNNNLTACGCRV